MMRKYDDGPLLTTTLLKNRTSINKLNSQYILRKYYSKYHVHQLAKPSENKNK